jgi:hypothetical protein
MTEDKETEKLLEQTRAVAHARGGGRNLIPLNRAFYVLSDTILRLARSCQGAQPSPFPTEPPTQT